MMASMLYDSLTTKLLKLPDDVEVWPAHGAGSACGRNISRDRSSTIGVQRRTNYALRPMPREEFVMLMTTDFPTAPKYFSRDAEISRRGARMLAEIGAAPLSPDRVREEINRGAVLLDVRDGASFGSSHISGALNIGLGGEFASWCGTLLPADTPIVIAADSDDHANEAVMRLARVGIESAAGYILLTGGGPPPSADIAAEGRGAPLMHASIPQISIEELRDRKLRVLDVRRKGEYQNGHVPGAQHIALDELPGREGEVKGDEALAVICASGYRSSIASSLLQRDRVANVLNVIGGTSAWIRAGFSVATETRQT